MYLLKPDKFGDFNLDGSPRFVDCWASYYRYSVKIINSEEIIDYFSEINLENDLSESNIVNLLRWKDPKYLTNEILGGPNKGASNDRVDRVVAQLQLLNSFRRSEIEPDEFKNITSQLFPNGVIWQIFIFHICKPLCYPIADQHVFRSYSYHKNCELPIGWEKYEGYKMYFEELIQALHIGSVLVDNLSKRKQLDNALMVYGQFLNKYAIKS